MGTATFCRFLVYHQNLERKQSPCLWVSCLFGSTGDLVWFIIMKWFKNLLDMPWLQRDQWDYHSFFGCTIIFGCLSQYFYRGCCHIDTKEMLEFMLCIKTYLQFLNWCLLCWLNWYQLSNWFITTIKLNHTTKSLEDQLIDIFICFYRRYLWFKSQQSRYNYQIIIIKNLYCLSIYIITYLSLIRKSNYNI